MITSKAVRNGKPPCGFCAYALCMRTSSSMVPAQVEWPLLLPASLRIRYPRRLRCRHFSCNSTSSTLLVSRVMRYFCLYEGRPMSNPRYANGSLRRKYRARFKAMGAPCGICNGKLGPIHYDEPSDPQHPLSFVIDEIHPVSKWKQFGYESARAAAEDWNNLQAAHYSCNARKGNQIYPPGEVKKNTITQNCFVTKDGVW